MQKNGLKGLYEGTGLAMLGAGLSRAFYFGFYGFMRDCLRSKESSSSTIWKLVFAYMAASSAEFTALPFDIVRRHLNVDSQRQKKEFSGTYDCFKKVVVNKGWRALDNQVYANKPKIYMNTMVLIFYDMIRGMSIKKFH